MIIYKPYIIGDVLDASNINGVIILNTQYQGEINYQIINIFNKLILATFKLN